jgi:predicted MPP superfamily phosphohydrolase
MRLFLLVFFLIYGGMHVYVFLKARGAFSLGIRAGAPLALWMLFMVLAPIIVRITERHDYEAPARQLAYVGYTWLGLLFLFISASIALDAWKLLIHAGSLLIRKSPPILVPDRMTAFLIPIAVSIVITVYGYFESNSIRTERLEVTTPKLSGTLKVAQISDVHLGLTQGRKRLGKILDIVRAEDPDILVSTGDLVDGQIDGLSELIGPFREVKPRYGKYAIIGNHEYYAGLGQALAFIEQTGFTLLRGRGLTVEGLINIAGVDDPTQRYFGKAWYAPEEELLRELPRDRFTLLLKHRPYVNPGSMGLFDLQLSGHTHRGQIFPFGLVTRIYYPYLSGLFRLSGASSLYVSRGSGTWGPPVRFLSPPEVTIIEIRGE